MSTAATWTVRRPPRHFLLTSSLGRFTRCNRYPRAQSRYDPRSCSALKTLGRCPGRVSRAKYTSARRQLKRQGGAIHGGKMSSRILFALCLALALSQTVRGAGKPLNDSDVINMVKAGLTPRTIITDINHSKCDFDTTPTGLVTLKKHSVPEDVLTAMIVACSGAKASLSSFSGPTVLAKYVAGSYRKNGTQPWGLGCLMTDKGNRHLVFVPYKGREPLYWGWRRWAFVTHLIDPSFAKGAWLPSYCPRPGSTLPDSSLDIPLAKISTLARGQVQGMAQASASSIQLVTTVAGLSGFIGAVTGSISHHGLKAHVEWGAAAFALIGAGVYLNRRTQNYIAIFYNPRPGPKLVVQSRVVTRTCAGKAAGGPCTKTLKVQTTKAPPAPPLFCKCKDFAVFQIIDPHDYWNTSNLLEAETGLTFVSQTAEKGTSPASPSK